MVPHFTLLTPNKLIQQTIVMMEKRLHSDSLLGSILEKRKLRKEDALILPMNNALFPPIYIIRVKAAQKKQKLIENVQSQ